MPSGVPTRRVVISGLGAITPLGNSPADFYAALIAGRSGIQRLPDPTDGAYRDLTVASAQFDPSPWFNRLQLAGIDRVSQFAVAAAEAALRDTGISAWPDPARAGIYLGTGLGGAHAQDGSYRALYAEGGARISPLTVVAGMSNAAAGQLSIRHRVQGPVLTYSVACASSAVAIGEAYRAVKYGWVDYALCGGSEALLAHGVLKAWDAMRTLARLDSANPAASCKPFSLDRSGFVLGEGCGLLLLEAESTARERGANIYAELAGYGCTSDASHMTKPDASGQMAAMRNALRDAELLPTDVGYINAHGTATEVGDVVETHAIRQVWADAADQVAVSSTKSAHGHVMGATGALEFIASVLTLRHGVLPPTLNLQQPDPQCDLDYVANVARPVNGLRAVMSNSFAFGGSNAVLIAKAIAE